MSLPITIVALLRNPGAHSSPSALVGFAYVGVVSMFLGFFAWYRGLAEGGVAKASQLQLGQPLMTIAWSAPLLGEQIELTAVLTAIIVAACVLVTQRARFSAQAGNAARGGPGPASVSGNRKESHGLQT